MATAKVYRSGAPATPAERGCERESYAAADAVKPAGRQGRMTAIFASPTLLGVTRWVRGNAFVKQGDVLVRELTVDPDRVYVYSVHKWECVSSWSGKWTGAEAYWESGMTLSEWLKTDHDPKEWEVLLGEEDLLAVKNVSDKRVAEAEADGYYRDELVRVLKQARAEKRWAAARAA